jgi:hypothetical protein
MIMRFRPANIRLINRRSKLPRLLLVLPSNNGKSNRNNKNNPTDAQALTGSLHISNRNNKNNPTDAQALTGSLHIRADVTVTIRAGSSGADLDSTVDHEGRHVEDAQGFASTVTQQGFYDLSKNLTSFQTEMNAYRRSNAVLGSEGQQRSFGYCGSGSCVLGGIPNPDPTIRMLLADPRNGYGVTEANPGARQFPEITTPNPAPQ